MTDKKILGRNRKNEQKPKIEPDEVSLEKRQGPRSLQP